MLILTAFFFLLKPLFAQETEFLWKPSSKKRYSGKCFEIDSKTKGQKYYVEVSHKKCRPKNTITIWFANQRKTSGKCYLIDEETAGQKYSIGIKPSKCAPEKSSYVWLKEPDLQGKCFLIDDETRGLNYSLMTRKDNCTPTELTYAWKEDDKNPFMGKCYAIDQESGGENFITKANYILCRPDNVSYHWVANSNALGGVCYEIDAINGTKGYSHKVDSKKCQLEDPVFKWLTHESGLGGTCFEESKFSNDEPPVIRKVSVENCRIEKTYFKFIKVNKFDLYGKCYEFDSETNGRRFNIKSTLENCRPEEVNIVWIEETTQNANCYEVDIKTNGVEFIQKVKNKLCGITFSKPKWIPSKDGWGGQCQRMAKTKKGERIKFISEKFCRPKKVSFTWHNKSPFNGNCYEVDKEKGNRHYSLAVPRKNCIPKNTHYYFHKTSEDRSGRCYEVDSETNGAKFHRIIANSKCKNKLNSASP